MSVPSNTLSYELNFGFGFVNTLQKKCFRIVNHSLEDIYRFQFPIYDKLLFIPAIGHLNPQSSKEIISTFLAKEPIALEKLSLMLNVCRITFPEPQHSLTSWDERQNIVFWEPCSSYSTLNTQEM